MGISSVIFAARHYFRNHYEFLGGAKTALLGLYRHSRSKGRTFHAGLGAWKNALVVAIIDTFSKPLFWAPLNPCL